ncbi:ATP-binding cassette domain-containing protein [Marinoscillum sp.]|uniref:ATP-binding cassette domain-containing protein n=1 Tax=Marinoscillum sp. TaxID=2024838 RepID=UPI003BA9A624
MTESIINALVHLFAIIESVKEDNDVVDSGEVIIKPYLSKLLNQELTNEYLRLFYDYLSFYREVNAEASDHILEIDSSSILQVAKICNQLNKELQSRERIIVFMQLLELINTDEKVIPRENEFISLVAMNFNLNAAEAHSLKSFIIDPNGKGIDKDKAMVIDNKMTEWPEEVAWMMRNKSKKLPGASFHHMYVENLFGKILVLHIASVDTYVFKYDGPLNLYLEGNKIVPRKFYLLKPGSIIKGPNIRSIYESEIIRQFVQERNKVKIVLAGEDLTYRFKDSANGIHKFSFNEESGNLIGIMGGSGVGKSTLINLLNGKLEPSSGRIHLNGHTIHRASQEGVIGYVPQDDMLFEELTVYQNLHFNAQICFSDFSPSLLEKTVNKILDDLDLQDIKDLKVGDPLNKFISGGQRKRLNIALELMREPAVLYVDEPTSGLSSMDSEKVMLLLKELARRGKLVIAIIHQPSSDIFKLFDKLWILDKGGYPIYNGNPIDAVVYFKTMSTQVNAAESECTRCGNVIPDQILQIIEAKEIDDAGRMTNARRVTPDTWYEKYQTNLESKLKRIRFEERLPVTNFHIPSLFHQFRIFSKRNLFAKLSNTQYILINLLEAPLLAFILGYFSKYAPAGDYVFADNKNLPVYLFMAVVVALFVGMSVSAEEIFKDRRILERESFLNLSRFSYINSKVVFLFTLSAIQTLSFVLVGNYVLEIQGMTWYYTMILFSTSCFANMIGLNISSALNSIITIYILIPFILVPQLLLGGAMIKFDELHTGIAKQSHVPLVGDIMASRWAYEALSVAQFKHNAYERHFFEADKAMSQNSFQRSYLIPGLETTTRNILRDSGAYETHQADFDLIRTEYDYLVEHFDVKHFSMIGSFSPALFSPSIGQRFLNYLDDLKGSFQVEYKNAVAQKDSIYESLIDKVGKDEFYQLKRDHFNESVSDLVENRNEFNKIIRSDNRLIQRKDPIFKEPYSHTGRAHFYASEKIIGDWHIDTVYFNVAVLWVMIGLLYLLLLSDGLKRTLGMFAGKKKNKNS